MLVVQKDESKSSDEGGKMMNILMVILHWIGVLYGTNGKPR